MCKVKHHLELSSFFERIPRPIPRDKRNGSLRKTNEKLSRDEMFDTLMRYHSRQSVLCASGAQRMDGLVSGHAYSILRVVRVKSQSRTGPVTLRLVQIRNPWGKSEWTGDWSDNSPLWDQHPDVKAKYHSAANDGAFWMHWDDYNTYWDRIGMLTKVLLAPEIYDMFSLRRQLICESSRRHSQQAAIAMYDSSIK